MNSNNTIARKSPKRKTPAARKQSAAAVALTAAINQRGVYGRQLHQYRCSLETAETTTDRAIYAEYVKHFTAVHKKQVVLVESMLAEAAPAGLFPVASLPVAPALVLAKSASLRDVLQAHPPRPYARHIKPAEYVEGSVQATVVNKAAEQLRAIYTANPARGEHLCYQSACAETYIASLEIADVLLDDREAAIARAIFLRAIPADAGKQRPTAVGALAQMQMLAIDAARKVRLLFSVQQDLIAA
jgi:hypothetical protein